MKMFRDPASKKKREGEVSFGLSYYSERDIVRHVDVECYVDGLPIGKMIATEIKNDRLESGLHLKRSYLNESYFFHGFLNEVNFIFEGGPRLRVNEKLRKYGRNILMVESIFIDGGELYPGESRDLFNLLSEQRKEYVYFLKERS